MVLSEATKRLFFGGEIQATWPKELPHGRVLNEYERHLTLAFLGTTSLTDLQKILPSLPLPAFRFAPVGKLKRFLFLPEKHPHVVAGEIEWLSYGDEIRGFQHTLVSWLKAHDFPIDAREFFPHVTIAREPFAAGEWKEVKDEIPLIFSAIHLYESIGNLTYVPRWSHAFLLPFEELEHTADIAFCIQAESVPQLHLHAQMALAFKFPPLLPYLPLSEENSLDDIVIALNDLVARADAEIGTPFKAVSFHGEIARIDSQTIEWEMIVDV